MQYELVFNNLLPKAALEKLDQSSLKGRTLSVRADKTAQQQDTANSKRRKTDADAAAADAKTTAPAARKDRVDSSAADASKDCPKGSRNTARGGERERRKRRGRERERERARERKRKRERERGRKTEPAAAGDPEVGQLARQVRADDRRRLGPGRLVPPLLEDAGAARARRPLGRHAPGGRPARGAERLGFLTAGRQAREERLVPQKRNGRGWEDRRRGREGG